MDKIVLIHGDVTLHEAKKIPATAKKIEWKHGFILERGYGIHAHTVENECEIYIDDTTGRMYLKEINEPIRLNHEEHGLQTIECPTRIVYKELEQEFDYESMEARDTED